MVPSSRYDKHQTKVRMNGSGKDAEYRRLYKFIIRNVRNARVG
jgi:hypothetical protein